MLHAIAATLLTLIAATTAPRAPDQSAEQNLAAARAAYEKAPDDPDRIIWLGRRTAYLGRYEEAIDIFTEGIRKHPGDARMYRHRGHRYISVRQFDRAVADLSKAAQLVEGKPDAVEPDGQPNARNIPTSTLNTNIYYHLGLAHYLRGEFERAAGAYRRCLAFSKNPDMLSATTHWLYMTLRRMDRDAEAEALLKPITADMDIIENGSYHKLLMMYKGAAKPEDVLAESKKGSLDAVTIGYGVANWHLYGGREDQALALLREIVEQHGTERAAFGYIAAEADLQRRR